VQTVEASVGGRKRAEEYRLRASNGLSRCLVRAWLESSCVGRTGALPYGLTRAIVGGVGFRNPLGGTDSVLNRREGSWNYAASSHDALFQHQRETCRLRLLSIIPLSICIR
jgi:hypothetical protein